MSIAAALRLGYLSLAFIIASCAPQIAAPPPTSVPSPTQVPTPAATPTSSLTVTETKVIRFTPAVPTEEREGYCWTASLADGRPDAYRCMIGNQISDPCFLVGDKVVFGANPLTNQPGFVLKLTQPLPEVRQPTSVPDNWAWIVELADGANCSFSTGATAGVEGKRLNYSCGRSSSEYVWILGDLQPGKVWQANKVIVTPGGPQG